jgi:Xaa-Pro dipeptidase
VTDQPLIKKTPSSELDHRIGALQAKMAADDIDGILVIQNSDLFYFSGTAQQAHLYIPATGQPLLMARKDLARARAESELERIVPLSSPRKIPDILADHGYARPKTLGLECDVLPVNLYFTYQKIFTDSRIVDAALLIRLVRAVKSEYEIEMITRAAGLADQVAAGMTELLEAGISEIKLHPGKRKGGGKTRCTGRGPLRPGGRPGRRTGTGRLFHGSRRSKGPFYRARNWYRTG